MLNSTMLPPSTHGLRLDLVPGRLVGAKGLRLKKLSVETINGSLAAQVDE